MFNPDARKTNLNCHDKMYFSVTVKLSKVVIENSKKCKIRDNSFKAVALGHIPLSLMENTVIVLFPNHSWKKDRAYPQISQ